MNFKLTKTETGYDAILTDVPDAMFCGSGRSMDEAIGACVRANRETIGATMEIHTASGEVLLSTEYGKRRRK
jgi:hypothetical protein